MNIKIGSFNCLNFGKKGLLGDKADNIAKIIKEGAFDIIALQEVKRKECVDLVVKKLNQYTNGPWKGCTDNDPRVNDYAFVWNSNIVDLPRTRLIDGSIRISSPHIYNQYKRDPLLGKISISRPPFYGRFQTKILGMPKIEIRLINTHIRYSKGKDGKELDNSITETILRNFEFKELSENIYCRVSQKAYGKSEGESSAITAYTILLGDYNLNLKSSGAGSPYVSNEKVEIECKCNDDRSMIMVTKQSELTTLRKSNSEDGNSGAVFANNFDHFTYDKQRFSGTSKRITKIDTVKKYCNNDVEKHMKDISDHVPIKMTLSIKKGELL